jgi:serine/threonine protein kinase
VNIYNGSHIGKYIIEEFLGAGGMAEVYKAYDPQLKRPVALKLILPIRQLSKTSLRRFEREARTLAKLNHPNIVQILDVGGYQGQPYIVTDFIPGQTLEQICKGDNVKPSRLRWKEAARMLAPVAHALAYAHTQGIVHRDVKPSNILVREDGQPMLVDFGIAKLLEAEDTIHLTGTGFGIGTPEYMAPEQCLGKEVDGRADTYSLGVVYYRLVIGKVPYEGDTPMEVVMQHLYASLPELGRQVRGIPFKIQQMIIKALSKKPEERFASMQEFAEILEKVRDGDLRNLPFRGKKLPTGSAIIWLVFLTVIGLLVSLDLSWTGNNGAGIQEISLATLIPTLSASELTGLSPAQKTAYVSTLSAQSTMSAGLPTPTEHDPTPTQTPTITSTPGAEENWARSILQRVGNPTPDQVYNFDNNAGPWQTYTISSGAIKYQDGLYHMEYYGSNDGLWMIGPWFYSNLIFEFDLKFNHVGNGSQFGIGIEEGYRNGCRVYFYGFNETTDRVSIETQYGANGQEVRYHVDSAATSLGIWRRFKVVILDKYAALFIDDHFVNYGYCLLLTGWGPLTFKAYQMEVDIDDVKLWNISSLSGQFAPPFELR